MTSATLDRQKRQITVDTRDHLIAELPNTFYLCVFCSVKRYSCFLNFNMAQLRTKIRLQVQKYKSTYVNSSNRHNYFKITMH